MNINPSETIFIMTTNNLSKVDLAVIDRCYLVGFNAASNVAWLHKVRGILADFGIADIGYLEILNVIAPNKGTARGILASTRLLIGKRLGLIP